MRRFFNGIIGNLPVDDGEAEAVAVGAARNDPVAVDDGEADGEANASAGLDRGRPNLPSTDAISPSPLPPGESSRLEAAGGSANLSSELYFTASRDRPTQTIDWTRHQRPAIPIATSPLPPPSTPRAEEATLHEATGPRNQDPLPGATPARRRSRSSLSRLFETARGDQHPPMPNRDSPLPSTPTHPPEETSIHDVIGPGFPDPQPDATPPRRRTRSSFDSNLFQTARGGQHPPMLNPSPSPSPPTPPPEERSPCVAIESAIQGAKPVGTFPGHRPRSPRNPSLFQTARQHPPMQNADSPSPSPPTPPTPEEVSPPEAIGHGNQDSRPVATPYLDLLSATAPGHPREPSANYHVRFPSPLPFDEISPPDAEVPPSPGQDVHAAHPYPQTPSPSASPAPGEAITAPLPQTAPSPAPPSPPRPIFHTGNEHCLPSSPLPESAGNLVTAGVGLGAGPLRRQTWVRLEEQLLEAHIQRAALLRDVFAADEEAFRLCPCPRGHVELREVLFDPASAPVKRGGGRTEASLERRRELFHRASESLTMARGLGVAVRAFMEGVRKMNAVCGAEEEYRKWLRFQPRYEALVRWMMCIDAQTGGLHVRVADLEAKVLHVNEMCSGICVGERSAMAAKEYVLALRKCVRESEDAIADLLLTRHELSDSLDLVLLILDV